MLALQAAESVPPAIAMLRELRCRAMIQRGDAVESIDVPSIRVLEQAAAEAAFAPRLSEGTSSLGCGRPSIVPAPRDSDARGAGAAQPIPGDQPRRGPLARLHVRPERRIEVAGADEVLEPTAAGLDVAPMLGRQADLGDGRGGVFRFNLAAQAIVAG